MNLHIASDEKFIDFLINDIEQLGLQSSNQFLIYTLKDEPLRYVKSKNILQVVLDTPSWNKLIDTTLHKYDRIFIHYLSGYLYELIAKIPDSCTLIWCFYGQDGFLYFPEKKFLYPATSRLMDRMENEKRGKLFVISKPLFACNRFLFLKNRRQIMKKAINRVDYFANFMVSDYYSIRAATKSKARHIEVTLASLESILNSKSLKPHLLPDRIGTDIMIGNSASFSNNHLDVFQVIKNISLSGKLIYCPLSYGDSLYADEIQSAGQQIFGKNFISLRNFMPLVDYHKILHSCGYVIMNHRRTQAAGNVIMSIYMGAKVFLSPESGLYEFLKNLGVRLFSIEDIKDNSKEVFIPLSEEEIISNRMTIFNYFNEKMHHQRLNTMLVI